MSLGVPFYLALLFVAVCFYWTIPTSATSARGGLLVIVSSCMVLLISPIALVVAISTALLASFFSRRLALKPSKPLAWGAAFALAGVLVYSRFLPISDGVLPIVDLTGSAFFVLKGIAIISEGFRFQRHTRPLDALLLVLFFPTYEAGPLEQPKSLNRTVCGAAWVNKDATNGVGRILVGLLKQSYLAPVLVGGLEMRFSDLEAMDSIDGPTGTVVFLVWITLKWLQIYIMFSGYSDVAIGSARLFGIKVRENFNFPFMARNIQDFWKRWHISLIDFMSAYIYQPFVRRTGRRYLGILLLFMITALWHAFNVQYIVWGLLHGSAMIFMAKWQRHRINDRYQAWIHEGRFRALPVSIAARLTTLFFVIWVSAIGNAPTWSQALHVLSFGYFAI